MEQQLVAARIRGEGMDFNRFRRVMRDSGFVVRPRDGEGRAYRVVDAKDDALGFDVTLERGRVSADDVASALTAVQLREHGVTPPPPAVEQAMHEVVPFAAKATPAAKITQALGALERTGLYRIEPNAKHTAWTIQSFGAMGDAQFFIGLHKPTQALATVEALKARVDIFRGGALPPDVQVTAERALHGRAADIIVADRAANRR